MAGFTPFTDNYTDLSDEHGYQFEFRCDICGSGYRSEYQRSALGTAGSLLGGASNLIGGLWGASNAADTIRNVTDRGARDEALKKAANEIMPLFKQCPRDHRWVDETCWNEERGLCVHDAPKLATEIEAERAALQVQQMREKMATETHFSRRHLDARDGLHELRQAGRLREVLLELRYAGRHGEVQELRQRSPGRNALLRQLRGRRGLAQAVSVPHTVQKRAPAASGAPHAEHLPAAG